MAKVISSFTMSLDGFIAEPNDDVRWLFKWYFSARQFLPVRRLTFVSPLQRHNSDDAADIRENLTALSGISQANLLPFGSIQRLLSCFPPAISADFLHKLQSD